MKFCLKEIFLKAKNSFETNKEDEAVAEHFVSMFVGSNEKHKSKEISNIEQIEITEIIPKLKRREKNLEAH